MLKAANVHYCKDTSGGYVTIFVRGRRRAVKSATDAGAARPTSGELISVHVIPRRTLRLSGVLPVNGRTDSVPMSTACRAARAAVGQGDQGRTLPPGRVDAAKDRAR